MSEQDNYSDWQKPQGGYSGSQKPGASYTGGGTAASKPTVATNTPKLGPGKIGSKVLSKGVIIWSLRSAKPANYAAVIIIFSPDITYRGKTITFLQAVSGKSRTEIDVLTVGRRGNTKDDFEPFYGADWDNTKRIWVPESTTSGARNQPGGKNDPNAYLYDEPVVFPGQIKMFESVVVIPETMEILGAISWGLKGRKNGVKLILPDQTKDVSDGPTAGFLVALDKFYKEASTPGPKPSRVERYDAILDGFPAHVGGAENAVVLTDAHKKKLDAVALNLKETKIPRVRVSIGGFADATEMDPSGTSEARARAVYDYLVVAGVPKEKIIIAGFFGAAWAWYPPTESRNRRAQVRVHLIN
ncbi:OmpA family protein [Marinobacter sp.]|uniref:OmpA family protein n=1 Tax=Marinobacter sp. TaxID=50741 RepID=UPI003A93BA1E